MKTVHFKWPHDRQFLNISIFSACEKFILGMWRVCNWDLTFDLQTSDLELDRERMTIKTRRRKWMTTWHEPSMPGALTGWGPSIARSSFSRSETKKSRWVDKLSNSVGLLLLRGLPFIPAILLSPPDIGRTLSQSADSCILGVIGVRMSDELLSGIRGYK